MLKVVSALCSHKQKGMLISCHTPWVEVSSARLFMGISHKHRQRTLAGFRDGRFNILIATDVAAHGLDIPNVDLVIHFELPNNSEIFVHRSGRTGCAGKKGTAIVMYNYEEHRAVLIIKKDVGCKFSELPKINVEGSDLLGGGFDSFGGRGYGGSNSGRSRGFGGGGSFGSRSGGFGGRSGGSGGGYDDSGFGRPRGGFGDTGFGRSGGGGGGFGDSGFGQSGGGGGGFGDSGFGRSGGGRGGFGDSRFVRSSGGFDSGFGRSSGSGSGFVRSRWIWGFWLRSI
ncbi:hypothetical protein BS78_08G143900 [Paspalum vaginatum]|nr:hypothetical protein BS78_08G143900 [Paspalum vaginatum]